MSLCCRERKRVPMHIKKAQNVPGLLCEAKRVCGMVKGPQQKKKFESLCYREMRSRDDYMLLSGIVSCYKVCKMQSVVC